MSSKEIHEDKKNGACPSYSTVNNWAADLKRGRTTPKHELRSCRPKDGTTDLQVDSVHFMVLNDRRFAIQHIAHTLGIRFGLVQFILSDILHISKHSAS